MATLPETLTVQVVQGQSYLYVTKRVINAQTITLVSGPSAGTWAARAYNTTTGNLAFNATANDVALALQNIPAIGGNGVVVTRSGSGTSLDPYVYRITWQGHFLEVSSSASGQRVQVQPLVTVISAFTPTNYAPVIDYVPFDFTGWGARMTLRPLNADGSYGAVIVEVTDATTITDPGRIYVGWVDPTSEGGTPGTLDPTNGKLGILVTAARTGLLTPAQFLNAEGIARGKHVILGTKGTWAKALYSGDATLITEPPV